MATVVVLTTADVSPWTVPGDFDPANNTIELIGSGGTAGSSGAASGNNGGAGGGGGGGGEYRKLTNFDPGVATTVAFVVGGGGGQDTQWKDSSTGLAKGGTVGGTGVTSTPGGGGAGGTGGTGGVGHNGGAGASGITNSTSTGGAGGGGGGAGGPTAGNNASGQTGGKGDGTAGGAGGTSASLNGVAGTELGGGVGAGGGGGGPNGSASGVNGVVGGLGGAYGAGAGGSSGPGKSGSVVGHSIGKQGVIIITYTPNANKNVQPGTGSLVATGFAPTVQTPINAQPGVGALVATGFAPTVRLPINVQPGVASLVATGFAPTVSISDNQNAQPGTGQFTATGYAPTVQTPRNVQPGVGDLQATGFPPTVSVSDNKNVTPGTGALVVQGYAPTVETPVNARPGTGAVTATGYAPSVDVSDNQNATPGTGELLATGFAPTVTVTSAGDVDVHPGTGEVIATGYPPTVEISGPPTPSGFPDGGYRPYIVEIDAPVDVRPRAGSIVATGYAPTVTVSDSQVIEPQTAELIVTGYAPTVELPISVRPGAGTIVALGHAPTVKIRPIAEYNWNARTKAIRAALLEDGVPVKRIDLIIKRIELSMRKKQRKLKTLTPLAKNAKLRADTMSGIARVAGRVITAQRKAVVKAYRSGTAKATGVAGENLAAAIAALEANPWSDAAREKVLSLITALAKERGASALNHVSDYIGGSQADFSKLLEQANEKAVEWASDRVGNLITEVSDTTRDVVNQLVANGIAEGMTNAEIADQLEGAFGFSADRSMLIARTETAFADSAGTLIGFRESGVVVGKEWDPDEDACEICIENADAGVVDLDEDFPSGDDGPPAHPNCECSVLPVVDQAALEGVAETA